MKSQYYIRVLSQDDDAFREHLLRNDIGGSLISRDITQDVGSNLYSLRLEEQEASALKLTFSLKGCLNFNNVLASQLTKHQPNTIF